MNPSRKVLKPKLAVIGGRVTATSLAVAEHFDKRHSDVLRAIKSLGCSAEFHEAHFWPGEYIDQDGKMKPMYRLTRDGFAMLSIGFTSRPSRLVKRAYFQAFDLLETAAGINVRFGAGEQTVVAPALPVEVSSPTVGVVPSIFRFEEMDVRAFADDKGEPWFCASEICEILGYANSRKAIADHCREKGVTKRDTLTPGGHQEMTFINEGNLYRLIIKSRKPEAERFEQLVMDEILPTIRKTGRYEVSSPTSSLRGPSNEEVFLRLFYAFDQNVGDAILLWVLMQMGATSQWIAPTLREIAEASAGRISKSNVPRCAVKLKQRGLIDMKADLPWARLAYFVSEEAVMKLLQEAGKQLAGLPGIQADDDAPLLLGMGIKTLH